MKRLLVIAAVALLAISLAIGHASHSGASFTTASQSTITVTAGSAESLLHLYSQESDPNHLSGYFRQIVNREPAATGKDATLAIDFGRIPSTNLSFNPLRVFTIAAPKTLPAGVSTITVTAKVVDEAGRNQDHLVSCAFGQIGSSGRNNPVNLKAGDKVQANMTVKLPKYISAHYDLKVVITATYDGYDGDFFTYEIPCSLFTG